MEIFGMAVKLTVISSSGLQNRKKGKNVAPDAFVKLRYKEVELETSVVKSSNNPIWNKTFDLSVANEDSMGEIQVLVYDQNNSTAKKNHVFLGQCMIPLNEYCTINYEYADKQSLTLKPTSTNLKSNVGGNISFIIGTKSNSTPQSKNTKKSSSKKPSKNNSPNKELEYEEIINQSEDYIDEHLAIARNMHAMVVKTRQIGMSASEDLATQNEALESTQNDLDSVKRQLGKNEKNLASIKTPFGGTIYSMTHKHDDQKLNGSDKINRQIQKSKSKKSKKQIKAEKEEEEKIAQKQQLEKQWKPDMSHLGKEAREKESEFERTMDLIEKEVKGVKAVGLEIGDRIEESRKRLEGVQKDVEYIEKNTRKQTTLCKKN
eukprot:TRINITY_DN4949_c0_g1_i1.p1 TRINITY_DN4949_c0_g1~~TRINITY_DN4949_c0_g1_i1.p1  ORF type:complete len:375 (-),score=113.50 TRINITY_DN4949_c0_g1_i1:29-1153(-)